MTYFLIFIILFAAYTVEGLAGFGGAVIAIPFLSILLGLHNAVTLLLLISCLFGIYILLRKRRNVDWKQYVKIISLMALGLPVGILLGQYLPQNVLKIALGMFTITAAIKGLWFDRGEKVRSKFLLHLCLAGGGVLQGVFASGGPLVIIYAKSAIRDKNTFRATLFLVWLTLNVTLLSQKMITGQLGDIGGVIGVALAAWGSGILVGTAICRKTSAMQFEKIVYWILLAAGSIILCQTLYIILR